MFQIVLYQPEIPPNTGNVIRLCANTGAELHLIAPLGFELDDRRLRRAGLDYHEFAQLRLHADWEAYLQAAAPVRLFGFTTRARTHLGAVRFEAGDALVFGPETRGLPDAVLSALLPERRLRIPMLPESRSMNLSNAVAVALYTAWGCLGYAGAV